MCVIDLFSKYVWAVPLKDKRGIAIVNAFQKLISHQIKYGFIKVVNFAIIFVRSFWKSVVAERFIRTLKNKIFKHMTAVSRNVYSDVLGDILNEYSNTVMPRDILQIGQKTFLLVKLKK